MIIDDKGKLFGKISLVDIAIVAIIAVLAFGTYTRFFGNGIATIGMKRNLEIEYVLRIEEVRDFTTSSIQVGDKLADSETKKIIGEITGINVSEGRKDVTDVYGNHVLAEMPERYTLDLTVRTEVSEQNNGYWVRGKAIKQGNTKNIYVTKRNIFAGDIISIKVLSDTAASDAAAAAS